MSKEILVSIVIPLYNTEKYISEALLSLINQNFKLPYEIIVVNDGSTDKSRDIVENLSNKYKFIKIINQTNRGAGEARNNGLKNALGKYVLFLDSDDIFKNNLISTMYFAMEKDNLDIGIYGYSFFDSEKIFYNFHESDNNDDFFINISSVPWDKMFKRSFLLNNNIFYCNTKINEDRFFNILVMLCEPKVSCVKESLIYYRKPENSLSTSREKNLGETIKMVELLKAEVAKRNIKYSNLEKMIKKLFIYITINDLDTLSNDIQRKYFNYLYELYAHINLDKEDLSKTFDKRKYRIFKMIKKKKINQYVFLRKREILLIKIKRIIKWFLKK